MKHTLKTVLLTIVAMVFAHTAKAAATGGTISTSGSYTIHTFSSSGTLTLPSNITVDMVIVAGGGGGGHQHAGGGGAGGVLLVNSYSASSGSHTITVGGGGAGCTWYPYTGNNGGNSSALGSTAIGGGAGTGMSQYGNAGGSGGSDGYPSGGVQGGNGTAGQGNTGSRGSSLSIVNGGGGGGGGGAGSGAYGGAALSTWAGTFAGGGGGGFAGGPGGGAGAGNGGSGAATGAHATANTGSGGGGGGNYDAFGGNGGSGKVIIRYLTPPSNTAPTVSTWPNLPTGPLYKDTQFTVNATGSDVDGNLTNINVDISTNGGTWTTFAHNTATSPNGNGSSATSDNTTVTAGDVGTTYKFRAMAIDSSSTDSGWQTSSVYTVIINNQSTVSLSPGTQTVTTGTNLLFTPSGGGQGGYNWGGTSGATGTGSTKTISFPTNGTYTVTVSSPGNVNYNPSNVATTTITVVTPTPTTFAVSPTTFTYTGSDQGPTVTPTPAAATYVVTGTGTATSAGSYTLTATANNIYSGTSGATNWTINHAAATVTLGSLSQAYNGTPRSATAATSPSGLTVDLTYDGSSTAPTALGSYTVVGTINDANYQGSATGTLVIGQATATVTLSNLTQSHTGSGLSATVTTSPSGLPVSVTYDGSATPPNVIGFYVVVATVTDTNYQGSATGTFTIAPTTPMNLGIGGTISTSGSYTIHKFIENDTFTLPAGTTVDMVIVAGGGGGGHQHAGGGGAGGVLLVNSYAASAGTHNITVGGGGAGCTWYPYTGNNGGNSSAMSHTAIGGGAGTGMSQYGNAGGSGGGDGYPSGGVQGGNATAGQGNTGSRGNSLSIVDGGGGGGAGGAGSGTAGGAALGTWAGTFGGGGGGGFGGGAGGYGAGNGGSGAAAGGHATAHTGSGGGGGGNYDAFGGNGGYGVVFIRYLTPPNNPPSRLIVDLTGPTVGYDSVNVHHIMWINNTLTFTSTLQDPDGNLVDHTLRYQKVINPSNLEGNWTVYDDPIYGEHTPSDGYNSTKQAQVLIETPGRWEFSSYGHDGIISHPGASLTIWVYGDVNGASMVSQKINGTTLTGASPTITLDSGDLTTTAEIKMENTGTKPWAKELPDSFGTPHRLRAIGTDATEWGTILDRDMNETLVTPNIFPGSDHSGTFAFTFDIPQPPGTYVFQWQMVEDGVAGGDDLFEAKTTAVTVTVVDTTPPVFTTPNLNATNVTATSLRLNWNAATENGPVLSYDVYLTIDGVPTLMGNTTNLWWDLTGLLSGNTYQVEVVAKDGVGLTTSSGTANVTTYFDPNLDNDGDGVSNGTEQQLGLDWNDDSDVNVHTFTYDRINQLKEGPGGEYIKDAEGNIKEIQP